MAFSIKDLLDKFKKDPVGTLKGLFKKPTEATEEAEEVPDKAETGAEVELEVSPEAQATEISETPEQVAEPNRGTETVIETSPGPPSSLGEEEKTELTNLEEQSILEKVKSKFSGPDRKTLIIRAVLMIIIVAIFINIFMEEKGGESKGQKGNITEVDSKQKEMEMKLEQKKNQKKALAEKKLEEEKKKLEEQIASENSQIQNQLQAENVDVSSDNLEISQEQSPELAPKMVNEVKEEKVSDTTSDISATEPEIKPIKIDSTSDIEAKVTEKVENTDEEQVETKTEEKTEETPPPPVALPSAVPTNLKQENKDKMIADLGSEKEVEVEIKMKPTDPTYTSMGRGLVYNCEGKHWACVDKTEFFQCKDYQLFSKQKKQVSKCLVDAVYLTIQDCHLAQQEKINQFKSPNTCSP